MMNSVPHKLMDLYVSVLGTVDKVVEQLKKSVQDVEDVEKIEREKLEVKKALERIKSYVEKYFGFRLYKPFSIVEDSDEIESDQR